MAVVSLNSNIASLKATRALSVASRDLDGSIRALGSGLRITRASDDAAGLQIAADLRADTRIFAQGVRNVNDAISAVAIGEGALNELESIVVRLRELAAQASNGVYDDTQRSALDREAQALTTEYSRIIGSTSFNGQSLFSDDAQFQIQAGYSSLRLIFGVERLVANGQFAAPFFSNGGDTAGAIDDGDLNSDGFTDFVRVAGLDQDVGVFFGSANGTFSGPTNYQATLGGYSSSVVLIDTNGDDALDIVTNDDSGNLTLLLNNGDGTFGAVSSIASFNAASLRSGDLNGDGREDLLFSIGNSVGVMLNNGNGTFAPEQLFGAGSSVTGIDVGDLNNDGRLDVIAGSNGTNELYVLLGNGNGTLQPGTGLSTMGSDLTNVRFADLNDDGNLDAITVGNTTNRVTTFLGDGTGNLAFTFQHVQVEIDSFGMETGDLNGDGLRDIVLGGTGDLHIYDGNGDGTFDAPRTLAVGGATFDHRVYDANADGILDIVSVSSNSLATFIGDADVRVASVSALTDVNLRTRQSALETQDYLRTVETNLHQIRAVIGGQESRLSIAALNLGQGAEEFTAAESRIVDADIGLESSKLVRGQILQQGAAAVLAQANTGPALALQLLEA